MGWRGRLAIVTGGGSGIGRAIAQQLAQAGWTVCVADVNENAGSETVAQIRADGGQADFERLDVTSETDWLHLRDRLKSRYSSLHLLVNNAGVSAGGELEHSLVSTWDWVLGVNLRGSMLGCHTMIPWLRENPERSHILNMASVAGFVFSPRSSAYNTSKAALVALSETLYHELRPYNIGVTAVCPWFCQTNLLNEGRFVQPSERSYAQWQMQNTFVTAEAVARKGLAATFRNRPFCIVGRRAQFIWILQRFSPWTGRKLLQFLSWTLCPSKEPAQTDGDLNRRCESAT